MGDKREQYVYRQPTRANFEVIHGPSAKTLSPLAVGILAAALAWAEPHKPRPTAEEIYDRWKAKLGPVAPSKKQISAALRELDDAGHRHAVKRRHGSKWMTAVHWYRLPVFACDEGKACITCAERPDGPPPLPAATQKRSSRSDPPKIEGSEHGNAQLTPGEPEAGTQNAPDARTPQLSDPPITEGQRLTSTQTSTPQYASQDRNTAYAGSRQLDRVENTAYAGSADAAREQWQQQMTDDITAELNADGIEERVIEGMVNSGCNRKVIVNTINKLRREGRS